MSDTYLDLPDFVEFDHRLEQIYIRGDDLDKLKEWLKIQLDNRGGSS